MARRQRTIKLKKVREVTLPHYGDTSAPVLVVLDPVVGSTNNSKPVSAKQMKWIGSRLKEHGDFSKEDVQIISCATGMTHDDWSQTKLVNEHLKNQHDDFHKDVKALKPKLILPMGAKACQQISGRSVKITKVRGQVIKDPTILNATPILPLLSPFYCQRHPEQDSLFCSDLSTAKRLHKNKYSIKRSIQTYTKKYRWCTDLNWLVRRVKRKSGKHLLAVDIEGIGLKWFDPETCILTVQICWKPGHCISVPINYDAGKYRHHKSKYWHDGKLKKIISQLKTILEHKKVQVVGQNFKFDFLFLMEKLGIEVRNYEHDTLLLAHMHDENMQSKTLDDLIRVHVPIMAGFNDVHNLDPVHQGKSRMDLLPPDKMLDYGCGDTDATFRLCHELLTKIKKDRGIHNCYRRVVMPAQRAFCYVEPNGFSVNRDALIDFERALAAKQKRLKKRLLRMLPQSIKDKHRNTGVGLQPNRAAILIDYMYEHEDGLQLQPVAYTKTKRPSVSSKQAMPFYAADHKFIPLVMEYIKNERMLSTYAAGFHKYIHEGLVLPSYLLHVTVTGRAASRDPNGQNFPKRGDLAKKYRAIFEAEPGWVYCSCDLSQAELRIAAMMSGDLTMLEVYLKGGDIHKNTAAGVMGITIEEFEELPKEQRDLKRYHAKAVNFGFLYGMWWKKFRHFAKTDYGIDFTEEEAQHIREMFFNTYRDLEGWHNDVKEFAAEHGMVRTYDGRVRHLPMVNSEDEGIVQEALRQAVNSPVQAIASDLGIMSIGRLVPYLRKTGKDAYIKICGFIHDAIVFRVKEEYVAEALCIVQRFMQNNPLEKWFDWKPEVPIIADAEIGRNLSEVYEIDNKYFLGKHKKRSYSQILHAMADDLTEEKDQGYANKIRKNADQTPSINRRRPNKKTQRPRRTGTRISSTRKTTFIRRRVA